jgi:OOP family OmpA-OmpF porin
LYDIEFDPKEATLKSSSRNTLNEIGQIIEDWPELKVEIGGHTDSQNESAFNQDLSDRRARNVRSYLLENFDIDTGQLVAVGYGELRPVASNDTEEGRARNRRVEFKVLNKSDLKKTTKTR